MKRKKVHIPFWLQITCILLAGVLASGAVLLFFTIREKKQLETHTVTFAYLDGSVIETKEVEEGKGVYPPIIQSKGVFRGWSKAFNAVEHDLEVHPQFHTIAETNLFYFNSVYVKEGTDFTLDICLGGTVHISSGTLIINYDTNVLSYKSFEEMGNCLVTEENAGELHIQFSTETPLTEAGLLTQLSFYAKEKDAYCTQLDLRISDPVLHWEGKDMPADCATINNKIYFLQEVDE